MPGVAARIDASKIPSDILRPVREAMYRVARSKTVPRIRAITPVRTGATRRDWQVGRTPTGIVISNAVPYARFINRGGYAAAVYRVIEETWEEDACEDVGEALERAIIYHLLSPVPVYSTRTGSVRFTTHFRS